MRPFEGFQRRAVVIVPSDDEFQRRCEQREKVEGKEIPDSAVLEMKGRIQRAGKSFTSAVSVSSREKHCCLRVCGSVRRPRISHACSCGFYSRPVSGPVLVVLIGVIAFFWTH